MLGHAISAIAVLLMAGPGGAYLTGQTITVDGGVLAGGSWDD